VIPVAPVFDPAWPHVARRELELDFIEDRGDREKALRLLALRAIIAAHEEKKDE
jgi:hypothetical protein